MEENTDEDFSESDIEFVEEALAIETEEEKKKINPKTKKKVMTAEFAIKH